MKTPSWFLKKNLIAWLLLPLSVLYFIASRFVFFVRRFHQKSSKIPVICVGGLMAGGVGKTPIVGEIAKKLGGAVVMRGYHGGDEAKMLRKSGLTVFEGAGRAQSMKMAEKAGFKMVIMDDGFQNPTIKKDLSILVFDAKLGVGNGMILPAGPMRETLSAIHRADAIIIIGNSQSQRAIVKSANRYKKPVFYVENKTIIPRGIDKFIAFAGIGYPQKFFNNLPKKPVKTISFPDHYEYTNSDIKSLLIMARENKSDLLTTEKDWVRLSAAAQRQIGFSPLETKIPNEFYSWVKKQLAGAK